MTSKAKRATKEPKELTQDPSLNSSVNSVSSRAKRKATNSGPVDANLSYTWSSSKPLRFSYKKAKNDTVLSVISSSTTATSQECFPLPSQISLYKSFIQFAYQEKHKEAHVESLNVMFVEGVSGSGKDFFIQHYLTQLSLKSQVQLHSLNLISSIQLFLDTAADLQKSKCTAALESFVKLWIDSNGVNSSGQLSLLWFRDIDDLFFTKHIDWNKLLQNLVPLLPRITKRPVKFIFSTNKPLSDVLSSSTLTLLEKSLITPVDLSLGKKKIESLNKHLLKVKFGYLDHSDFTRLRLGPFVPLSLIGPLMLCAPKSLAGSTTTPLVDPSDSIFTLIDQTLQDTTDLRKTWKLIHRDSDYALFIPHVMSRFSESSAIAANPWNDYMVHTVESQEVQVSGKQVIQWCDRVWQEYAGLERLKPQQPFSVSFSDVGHLHHLLFTEELLRSFARSQKAAMDQGRSKKKSGRTGGIPISSWLTQRSTYETQLMKRSNVILEHCPRMFGKSVSSRTQICMMVWFEHVRLLQMAQEPSTEKETQYLQAIGIKQIDTNKSQMDKVKELEKWYKECGM